MDKQLPELLMCGFGLLFLTGLYLAIAARIEVNRLRSRVTELEDKVRQLVAILDEVTHPPGRQGEEGAG